MIRVTIELVPFGDDTNSSTIGTLEISNRNELFDGMHLYDVAYMLTEISGEVKNGNAQVAHERKRNVFRLIGSVLDSINGGW